MSDANGSVLCCKIGHLRKPSEKSVLYVIWVDFALIWVISFQNKIPNFAMCNNNKIENCNE